MAAVSWPNADDALALDRRVRIIDDLLGAILVLAALAFAVLLELTRRRICAVYQLAFLLSAGCAVFLVGGLVDHHLSDDQLQLALFGSLLSSSMTTTYVYLPLGASAAAALAGVLRLSVCSCTCCCLQGSRCASHRECFPARLRANAALFATTFVLLWVLIGIRLNARLRASAINPAGGTVHWMLLRSPFYLSVAHVGSVAMVELKLFLQHADKPPAPRDGSFRAHTITTEAASATQPTHPLAISLAQSKAMVSTIDELMRPPPVPKIRQAIATTASAGGSSAATAAATAAAIVRRVSRPQTSSSEDVDPAAGHGDRYKASASIEATKLGRKPLHTSAASSPQRLTLDDLTTERPAVVDADGDVSALISSDSDSDEDVLTPSFSAASVRKAPLPSSSSASGSRRVASIASSERSSSRPASPAFSSVSSRSSSSSSSNSSSASRPRAPPARYGATGTMPGAQFRSSSGEPSFPARRYVSESDEGILKRRFFYYSDSSSGNNNNRPMTASSTTSSFSTSSSLSTSTAMSGDGLRRRIPSADATATTKAAGSNGPWVEYFDAATRRVYYYNQETGESRW